VGDGEIAHPVHLTEKEARKLGLLPPETAKPSKARRAASFSEASRDDTNNALGEARRREESTETQVDKFREEHEAKQARNLPSKTAVSKAVGKRKWTLARQAAQKAKAAKKAKKKKGAGYYATHDFKAKRNLRKIEKRHRKAVGKLGSSVLRHISASPEERRASIRRKTSLH
jgi:hypothetical protein